MALCLVGEAWAGNPGGKLRSLVSSFKRTEGFDVVDLGGPAMLLLKAAARAEADDPEDRAALDLFRRLKRLTVVDFSSKDGSRIEDIIIRADDALISVRGSIRADQVGSLMKKASK